MTSLRFPQPSEYIGYMGPVLTHPKLVSQAVDGTETKLRFIRLNAREGPLKYPYRFPNIASGATSASQNFGDLELLPKHIALVYFGISYGARAQVYHPLDERLLKWDQATLDLIQEKDTGNIDWEDSPIEDPKYGFWLAPTENFVPGLVVENVLSHVRPPRSLNIDVVFWASKYTYEFVTRESEAEIHDKLVKHQIPWRYATFGGKV